MNNNLASLNNILFEQIERINDDSLKGEELKEALNKAKTINSLSATVVANASAQLKAIELFGDAKGMPEVLGIGSKK